MVFRTYVEKKPGFDVEAQQLAQELRTILGIGGLTGLRVINRYDVEGVDEALFQRCVPIVFSEPQVDTATAELPVEGVELDERGFVASAPAGTAVFAVEYLPGQFDQRADSASECVQLVSAGERPDVRSAKVYVLSGTLSADDVDAIKHYVINPVEAREATLSTKATLKMEVATPADVEVLDAFLELDETGLAAFIANRGLAMDLADIKFCQEYFADEKRNPTITEIRVIDTYWSDHCRHTTFGTQLENVQIDDEVVKAAFDKYLEIRHELGRDAKPVCLMDMGTIGAKWLKKQGILKNLDESEEINACTVKVKVDVDGEDQDWLFLFKNETHNHPDGDRAVRRRGHLHRRRDPRPALRPQLRLPGHARHRRGRPAGPRLRDAARQAARSASSSPPPRRATPPTATRSASPPAMVNELYHPGYVAKRMEIGAVVGAAPADQRAPRERPPPATWSSCSAAAPAATACGGATGSSKAHDRRVAWRRCGAEVQKGNAPVERKLQRLFRNAAMPAADQALQRLRRGRRLRRHRRARRRPRHRPRSRAQEVRGPRRHGARHLREPGAHGGGRSRPRTWSEFLGYAHRGEPRGHRRRHRHRGPARRACTWRGDTIVDLSREFLASNGAPKHMDVARA